MQNKLRCILLDDELPGLAYLKMLCEGLPELEVVRAFNDPQKLLQEAQNLEFDLCITDVEMPGTDGITLAKSLKGKLIIFTTAYKEYAADAFDIEAVDYLTKPVKKERLEKAVHKAFEIAVLRKSGQKQLQFNTDKGRALIYSNRIVLIRTAENDSRDKELILVDGSRLLLKNVNFATLEKELPETDFSRVNKKEIVSIAAVRYFSHTDICVGIGASQSDITIPLSETYRSSFISKTRNKVITE